MAHDAGHPAWVQMNHETECHLLRARFRATGRALIPEFLSRSAAENLYEQLRTQVEWNTYVAANGRELGTSPERRRELTSEIDQEINQFAYQGAERGYAYVHDADRLPSRDECPTFEDISPLGQFISFVNSSAFIDLAASVTGLERITSITARAIRFRPGHFRMFREGRLPVGSARVRRASYVLNLTPEWRPEWGGMLEFRGPGGYDIEAYVPRFNTLLLYAFPQGNWISLVSSFAPAPTYAVSGAIY